MGPLGPFPVTGLMARHRDPVCRHCAVPGRGEPRQHPPAHQHPGACSPFVLQATSRFASTWVRPKSIFLPTETDPMAEQNFGAGFQSPAVLITPSVSLLFDSLPPKPTELQEIS